jgi:HD-GYP domain-containing protein (c-di-GMP phosphodiesterase class II)
MAIADIFEALTARDRPYRGPMKLSQAIDILNSMKDNGHIDPDIFELFMSSGIYLKYAHEVLSPDQIDM